jgi:hypothetical protein
MNQTDQVTLLDPFDAADNVQERTFSNEYWGECLVDVFFCVLEKGAGKVPYDEKIHSADKRLTAVKLSVTPLPEMGLKFGIDRDLIAEFKPWTGITMPSYKALGLSLRELNGKFIKCKLTATGEKYESKGESHEKTTVEFLKVFGNQAECEADYKTESGTPLAGPAAAPKTEAHPDMERETALKFLAAIVKQACNGEQDIIKIQAKLTESIVKMPIIKKYFTSESEETLNLIAENMK